MSDRRTLILDAAITLLGSDGVRALTHRAVDAQAGLPAGSTSNHFRTKDALMAGVVGRFVARERAHADELMRTTAPSSPKELADVMTAYARDAVGANRALTLARYALLVEGALRPSLQPVLAEAGGDVDAWAVRWMRLAGSSRPERDLQIIGNLVTGVILHELAHPTPSFDPGEEIAALVLALLCPSDGRSSDD